MHLPLRFFRFGYIAKKILKIVTFFYGTLDTTQVTFLEFRIYIQIAGYGTLEKAYAIKLEFRNFFFGFLKFRKLISM
jgi:hypothetical protein